MICSVRLFSSRLMVRIASDVIGWPVEMDETYYNLQNLRYQNKALFMRMA